MFNVKQLKKLAPILALSMVVSILPTSIASAANNNYENQKVVDNMKAADEVMESVIMQRNKEIAEARRNTPFQALFKSQSNVIIDKGDNELKAKGFEIYEVNETNHEEVEKVLNTNLDDLFRDEATEKPTTYTLYVYESDTTPISVPSKDSSLTTNVTTAATDLDWRSLYIYADYDPIMSKLGTYDVYKKYSGWPYNNKLNDIVSKTYGVVTSLIPNYLYLWTALGAFGIDYDSIGYSASETYDIEVGANWTRKYIQVYDDFYEDYLTCVSTEYVTWNSYDDMWYYNADLNQMKRATSTKQGTVYAAHWNDYTWLLEKAEHAWLYNYIVWDITGDYKFKYNGDVIINFNENF
ncbi:hypothetical protein [Paenibacillus tengchongensis]|uniref:hypothetical protein n=1 Tax=Paenibacillus tengchongensis TaxID=2608684 RepID=UPI00124E2527|nr:hypothetical protein [Paenibacillus tengchongensis]